MDERRGEAARPTNADWPLLRPLESVASSEEALRHLASAARAMQAVARVATAVAHALDTNSVVEAVLVEGRAAGLRASVLFDAREDPRRLALLGQFGVPTNFVDQLRRLSFDAPTLSADVATTRRGQSLWRKEADESKRLDAELMDRLAAQSVWAVPLVARDRLVGVYAMYLTESRRPTRVERWTLGRIAEVVAVGLTSARATDRERELCRSVELERRRLEAVMRSAPYPIMFVEAGTERVWANARAHELLQLDPDASAGGQAGTAVRPDGSVITPDQYPWRRVFRSADQVEEEAVVMFPSGRSVHILGRTARVSTEDGALLGAVMIFEDISAQRQLERLREDWSSIAAHDMKQPLSTITMGLSMLDRFRDRLPPPAVAVLDRCRNGAMLLERLICDLGDMSQIEAQNLVLDRQPIDVASAARDVAAELAASSGRVVSVHVSGPVPEIGADRVRLDQVLTNLISNAIKHSPDGSEVSIDVAQRDRDVSIDVTNAGRGIPPEDLPHVFDRYYRARRTRESRVSGLGLGLYIAKGLVEAHGGTISVSSTPGHRTTFSVRLPALIVGS